MADRPVMAEREVMTVPEVASYLRVHQSTIYRLLKKAGLPAFKIGADWRFYRHAVDEWAEARMLGGKVNLNVPREQVVAGVVKRSVRG